MTKGKKDRRTREGRAAAERAQQVHLLPGSRAEQQAREKAEEEAWAARSGPVTVVRPPRGTEV